MFMEINIDEIMNRINVKKEELNMGIEQSKDYDYIHSLSVEIDNLITERFAAEQFNEQAKQYDQYLNLKNKNELIKDIQEDTKRNRPNATDDEIECFSRNVYIYACLVANNVGQNEISRLLVLHNNIYSNRITDINEPIVLKDGKAYSDLQMCVDMANKYVKLVQENI